MNTKILTSVGCLLLLAAAISPAVLGHSQRTAIETVSGYAAGATPAGNGAGANGVSGRYTGSAGPAVADYSVGGLGVLATGGMLCDAEVAVDDNTAPGNSANEPQVDAVFGGTSPTGELWDDGGNGGACHTHHYSTPGFNTFGCQTGDTVWGGTHAGTDIFVGASCDWKEDQGGQSGEQTLVLCIVNSILAITPGNLVNDLLVLAQCVVDYVLCLTNPTGCVIGGIIICGADGTSDAINYGYAKRGATVGNVNQPGPVTGTPPYATFPLSGAAAAGCPALGDTAGVFVWDAVITDRANVDVAPALTGEVFS